MFTEFNIFVFDIISLLRDRLTLNLTNVFSLFSRVIICQTLLSRLIAVSSFERERDLESRRLCINSSSFICMSESFFSSDRTISANFSSSLSANVSMSKITVVTVFLLLLLLLLLLLTFA